MPPPRRLTVPLRRLSLPGLPIDSLEANVPLFVQAAGSRFIATEFRLDTGAHLTEVSADWARASHIAFGGPRLTLAVTSGAGTAARSGWIGSIRVRLPGWGQTEFDWLCFFRDQRPWNLPRQLGMAGILNDLRFLLDGTPTSGAPDGVLIVEERIAAASPGP